MAWPNRGAAYRPVVMGTRGMVTSAHFLASGAGMRMLQQGGNAIDAAVATAAALNCVEPYMSGIGGCGYITVYLANERRVRVLDYMATSGGAADASLLQSQDAYYHDPRSMLIPGAVGGWLTLLENYGTLDRATVFAPAIEFAEQGVPISLKNAYFFANARKGGHLTPAMQAVYFPGGDVPKPGAVLKNPALARTFREIVAGGQDAFYRGDLAQRIVRTVRDLGSWLTEEDFADFRPEWQEPVSTDYRGFTIACPPPPCSGVQYLEAFNILEAYDLAASGHNSADTIHLMAEAFKLAVADRIAFSAPARDDARAMLAKSYAAERRKLIDPAHAARSAGERWEGPFPAGTIQAGEPARMLKECTTHFDAVDAEGNAVSITQSLGDGFGCGYIAGECGFMLNNLGYWFDLDQSSPNALGPRKKIEMCMSPALITRDEQPFLAIGTPGSFGILQTTPQMISNVLDHGFSVQAAIEAPRFRAYEGTTIEIEARVPKVVRDELIARGHTIRLIDDWSYLVGGGQGILIDPESGVLMGAADPRRDGYAMGW